MRLTRWIKNNSLVLLAVMTAVVVIAVMLSAALITGHVRSLFDQYCQHELDLMRLHISHYCRRLDGELEAFALSRAVASTDEEEILEQISQCLERSPFSQLAVIELTGKWAVANCPQLAQELQAEAAAGKYAALPFRSTAQYRAEMEAVVCHLPYTLDGRDSFVAVGVVSLTTIQREIAKFATDLAAVIFDSGGRLLLANQDEEGLAWFETDLFPLLRSHLPDAGKINFSATDGQGVARYYYFARMPDNEWYVGIAKPRSAFLRQLVWPLISPFLVVVLVCVLFGLYVWQRTKRFHLEYMLNSMEQLQEMESLTTMGKMAAGIAHEVKNPLAVIDGYIQLMELYPKKYSNKRTLGTIREELERIVPILNEYLALGRKSAQVLGEVNINQLLQSILSLMEVYAYHNSIQFITRLAPSLPPLEADADKLRQVFINLLKNAIEAIDGGGTVIVTTAARDDEIVITVEDNGSGIPPEHLPWVDVPFFTTKDTGTGLGLPVSYRNVAEHGGMIQVQSTPGVGTKFTIILPGR